MMETLVQGSDWLTWIEQLERNEKSENVTPAPARSHESQLESWENTDRILYFPVRHHTSAPVWDGLSMQAADGNSARARWLQKHDIHTQFLDAGIGCCWFAQQGDEEPVCGETEDAAIARLVRENGLRWREA